MSIGSAYTETTDTLYNAGGDVKFVDFIMECDMTRSILTNEKLQLTVFDENSTRKDSFLGKGSISLRKVASALGIKVDIPMQLTDEKGSVCGNAIIKCMLSPGSVNVEPLINDSDILPLGTLPLPHYLLIPYLINYLIEHGKLVVSKMVLSDIFRNETLLNKIVPYVSLRFNNWKLQTKSLNINAKASDITFTTPNEIPTDLCLIANSDELKINQLQVTVKDQNMVTSDTIVGDVNVSLRKLMTSTAIGKDQVITAKIKETKRGRVVGRVAITARIEPHEIPKQSILGTQSLVYSLIPAYSRTHSGTENNYGYMDIMSCEITGFKYSSGISGVFSKPKALLDFG